jgi:hypothetical protein
MSLFRDILLEAKAMDIDVASDRIAAYFNRKMNMSCSFVKISLFSSKNGVFKGKLYVSDDLKAIRVNWQLENFAGISLWSNYSVDPNKPDIDILVRNINLTDEDSFVKILPRIYDAVKYQNEEIEGDIIKTKGASTKEVDNSETIKELKRLKSEDYSDVNTVYEDIEVQVKSVAKGFNSALLICGKQGGTGKSFTVKKALKSVGAWQNVDYTIIKGTVSPTSLYKNLYDYYDRVIVFDDCDSVLIGGTDSTNMLKAALDTGNHKIVSWENADAFNTNNLTHAEIDKLWSKPENKNKHPSSFEFSGGVIFISNLSKEYIGKKDSALLTRCLYVNVNIKPSDMIERMRKVLPTVKIYAARKLNGEPQDVTQPELLEKVFNFLSSDEFINAPQNRGKSISFRILNQIYLLALSGASETTWHRLAFSYMS